MVLTDRPRRTRDFRQGQATFIFVASFTMIAGILGLVLDGGHIFLEKRRAQAAADAGATGAVQEMRRGNRDLQANVRPAAVNDAGLHAYTDGKATITVNNPPLAGPSVGNNDFVAVIVSKQVATTFMRFFGPTMSTVRARAVSGLQRSGDACVISLNPDASNAIWANGTPTLTATCGIISNSTTGNTLRTNGGGVTITGTYIGAAGGYSGSGFNPTPVTGMLPMIDPFLNISYPTSAPNGYTTTAASSSAFGGYIAAAANGNGGGNGSGNGGDGGGGSTTYYWPGYYSSKIQVTNGNFIFMPGLYILEAGLTISGGTVNGEDVTFYNKNTAGNDFVDVGGNATVTLSAPDDDPNYEYYGILFMGPRYGNPRNPGNNIARGNSDSSFTGALYFPSEHLDWTGNPSSIVSWEMVVANTLNISGTADAQVINPPTEIQAPKTYRMMFSE
jgi:Flp pilus assembly protein TadG